MSSIAALIGITPMLLLNNSKINAANNPVSKRVMHTSLIYNKNGKSTGKKYHAYGYVNVNSRPVMIDHNVYYQIADEDQYIKVNNVDGVKRKITHNAYIYRTSTGRTSYNNKWKLYKGATVTTFGSSYRFKNGKHYFRIGGPRKQYIKSVNLGSVLNTNSSTNNYNSSSNSASHNVEETTVTVKKGYKTPIITFDQSGKVLIVKSANPGEKFTVDRLEIGSRANRVAERIGQFGGDQAIYRIKGTNDWLYSMGVTAAKKLPEHNYDLEYTSMIRFVKTADLFNANGTSQNIRIQKNSENWKVDRLLYLWVPSEGKAEEFYHLAPDNKWKGALRLSSNGEYVNDWMPIRDAYVKADDVQFINNSVQLTPSNTSEDAKEAALNKTN